MRCHVRLSVLPCEVRRGHEHDINADLASKRMEGFTHTLNNGCALIPVTNDTGDHAVWKVPSSQLEWALDQWPVRLVRLPRPETEFEEQLRIQRRRLEKQRPFLKPEMLDALIQAFSDLEAKCERDY